MDAGRTANARPSDSRAGPRPWIAPTIARSRVRASPTMSSSETKPTIPSPCRACGDRTLGPPVPNRSANRRESPRRCPGGQSQCTPVPQEARGFPSAARTASSSRSCGPDIKVPVARPWRSAWDNPFIMLRDTRRGGRCYADLETAFNRFESTSATSKCLASSRT